MRTTSEKCSLQTRLKWQKLNVHQETEWRRFHLIFMKAEWCKISRSLLSSGKNRLRGMRFQKQEDTYFLICKIKLPTFFTKDKTANLVLRLRYFELWCCKYFSFSNEDLNYRICFKTYRLDNFSLSQPQIISKWEPAHNFRRMKRWHYSL